MSYTLNPQLPKLRAQAVEQVRSGTSMRDVAGHYGFQPSTVSRWCSRAPAGRCLVIPTRSSRPHRHPKRLAPEISLRIKQLRLSLKGRCAEVIQKHLTEEGIVVHRITVQRELDRLGLTKKRSPWKRYHVPLSRPEVHNPGDLVQVDSIFIVPLKRVRFYVYTLLDVCSRWTYAWASERIGATKSVAFLKRAQAQAPFGFRVLQSDNGSEFSTHFSERAKITHRHSRVRRPNDNAHLERFNRTLQDECLRYLPKDVSIINRRLPRYLAYYNGTRYHLGINLKTPLKIIQECC